MGNYEVVNCATGSHNISDVINNMTKQYNELAERATFSPGACADYKGGESEGVIFSYKGSMTNLKPMESVTWDSKIFSGTHTQSANYQPACDFLNQLPLTAAVAAHVAMSDYQGGQATLVIFYPK